jgi:hypothetical protein
MAQTMAQSDQPALFDDASVREVFADTCIGISAAQGNVYITFATLRTDYAQTPNKSVRKISSRLVLPIAAVAELRTLLGQTIEALTAQGVIRSATPATGPTPPASK